MLPELLPLLLFAVQAPALESPPDRDADGDGLSDFHEVHKYFTDPSRADSDGDGVPDSGWEERREFAYTVRSVVQVAPPVTRDVLCDDYQDARILEETGEYVELEVIHYPLNTVEQAIAPDPGWRERTQGMRAWLRPGPTANWDEAMRRDLVAALQASGIDPDLLDDVELVRRASKWLLQHARYVDGFTTFCSTFPGGKAQVLAGMEKSAQDGQAPSGLSLEEQWQRELFAEGMFRSGVRGSCTSSAIYLNGCLRALGIPTRIVLCIPLVDGSDEREVAMAERRLSHPGVRSIVAGAARRAGGSWTSHTFNDVFVGGRWRRLNYDRLGQNVLDRQCLGLMTHVATFGDWADGEMARTWGLRQASAEKASDVFGFANPYSAIALSDRVGPHAKMGLDALPSVREHRALTIERLYWYHSPGRKVEMRLDDPETAGHLLAHVREGLPGQGTAQYAAFYDGVDKEFLLRAEGRPDVRVHATRGYWAKPEEGIQEFYLRIEPGDLARMELGATYALVPRNAVPGWTWKVDDGAKVARSR